MDSSNALGTAEIPQKFWKQARLIGPIPFIASKYDQRASYCMYVPESRYRLDSRMKLPLIVTIHGSLRRAERCRDSLTELADQSGTAILAPLFPCGIEDPNDTHNYKFIRYKDIRYDLILLSMVDEVSQRWPGIETSKFSLIGYSGGGQFAARFFYLHPDRLHAVSIGAPGTVTELDHTVDWPKGLKGVEEQFDGLSVDLVAPVDRVALSTVNFVQLIVGDQDIETPGGAFLKWAEDNSKKTKVDLPDRVQALEKLRDQLISAGIAVQFDLVPGVSHENMKVLPIVIKFLERALYGQRSQNGTLSGNC